MKNLVLRTLTGVIFVAVLTGSILWSALSFTVLFALVTALAAWEFATLVNAHAGAQVNRLINTVATVYLFLATAGVCECRCT